MAVSSVYLRLFLFFQAILIQACASSSMAFRTMCSAYKLNMPGDNVLDVFLSQFASSLFFHVQFWLLLLDLHTDFSGGREGALFSLLHSITLSVSWFSHFLLMDNLGFSCVADSVSPSRMTLDLSWCSHQFSDATVCICAWALFSLLPVECCVASAQCSSLEGSFGVALNQWFLRTGV